MSAVTGQNAMRPNALLASMPRLAQAIRSLNQNVYVGTVGVCLGAGISTFIVFLPSLTMR